jgi:hypothetical protein
MKTKKIIPVLSLVLILFAVITGYAKKNEKFASSTTTVTVRYEVNIHFSFNQPLCNMYQVEIRDAGGKLVAPAQYFVPGKAVYTFIEKTSLRKGTRIAQLVLAPDVDRFACDQELYIAPVAKLISFTDRETYKFDLNPILKQSPVQDLPSEE